MIPHQIIREDFDSPQHVGAGHGIEQSLIVSGVRKRRLSCATPVSSYSKMHSLVRPGKAESLHDLFLVLLHVRVVLPAQHGNLFAAHRLFMERARN